MAPLNDWNVTLPMISLLERVLKTHSRVESFSRERDIFFRVTRRNNYSAINALLVCRYTIGLADVIRAQAEFPEITCIVANGNWCGYTQEAKDYGMRNNVGVFNIAEMNGTLASRVPNRYAQKDSKGKPVYAYRSP